MTSELSEEFRGVLKFDLFEGFKGAEFKFLAGARAEFEIFLPPFTEDFLALLTREMMPTEEGLLDTNFKPVGFRDFN